MQKGWGELTSVVAYRLCGCILSVMIIKNAESLCYVFCVLIISYLLSTFRGAEQCPQMKE